MRLEDWENGNIPDDGNRYSNRDICMYQQMADTKKIYREKFKNMTLEEKVDFLLRNLVDKEVNSVERYYSNFIND